MSAANRLGAAASPYLRQHAANPVHWQPWDHAAFDLARSLGKPVLLSIGYSACHWCHVMARESFEDDATAALMNELFVCIKVDREERPDLDRLLLGALARLGTQAGWPLTAFLTPDGEPYAGGGYFPPAPRFGLPGFPDVLRQAAVQYRGAPDTAAEAGRRAIATPPGRVGGSTSISESLLDRVAHELARSVDWLYGGFGIQAPKFLHAGGHEILLRGWARTGEPGLLDAALGSMRNICDGGVYDHVGGGFHRYAADDRWRVPHFEKMLCDNALMVSLLVKMWQATRDPGFASRVEGTVAWLLREMRLPDGTFASSLASDLNGIEGGFYTWDRGETRAVLDGLHPAFAAAYGEADDGPFAGRAVIYREPDAGPAPHAALDRLRLHRAGRGQPARDNKVLADWNGLAIAALAEAGLAFGRADWTAAARLAFDGVAAALGSPDGLRHCAFDGRSGPPGFLDDYACMARAALSLHEATGDAAFVDRARAWVDVLDARFWDEAGGYFFAEAGMSARQTLIDETAAPSGNGTMLGMLPRLAALCGADAYRRRAEAIVRRFADRLSRASIAAATALNNAAALDGLVQIVVVANPALACEAAAWLVPDRLLIPVADPATVPPGHPAHGKTASAAYVCVGPMCLARVTDPAALGALLSNQPSVPARKSA